MDKSDQALLEKQFRVFNQMTESMTIADMAKVVATAYPGPVDLEYVENPRVEAEGHYYHVIHRALVGLGLEPHTLSETLVNSMFAIVERYQQRVDRGVLRPSVDWRKTSNPTRLA